MVTYVCYSEFNRSLISPYRIFAISSVSDNDARLDHISADSEFFGEIVFESLINVVMSGFMVLMK